jgi:hypothetical protein
MVTSWPTNVNYGVRFWQIRGKNSRRLNCCEKTQPGYRPRHCLWLKPESVGLNPFMKIAPQVLVVLKAGIA